MVPTTETYLNNTNKAAKDQWKTTWNIQKQWKQKSGDPFPSHLGTERGELHGTSVLIIQDLNHVVHNEIAELVRSVHLHYAVYIYTLYAHAIQI